MLERKLAVKFVDKNELSGEETVVECFLTHAGLDIKAGWSTVAIGFEDLLDYMDRSDDQIASASSGFCEVDDNCSLWAGDYMLIHKCFRGVFPKDKFEQLKSEVLAFKPKFFDPFKDDHNHICISVD